MTRDRAFALTARWATLIVGGIGLLALAGWAFDLALLKSVEPQWIAMRVLTAVCFVLAAVELTLVLRNPGLVRSHPVLRVPGWLVALVGLSIVALYAVRLITGHLDAPAHVLPGGLTVDNLPVVSFLSAVCVVDVRENVQANADYSISAADLERHSKTYGPVPFGCLVFFCTGWAKRWPSQEKYIHKDMKGMKHFPGVSEEATRYLLDQVCPTGVGIDTPSVEGGMGKDFDVHRLLLGGGVYILENVGNLERLPPRGAAALTLPLKLAGGSGSPARVLALIPNSRDHP